MAIAFDAASHSATTAGDKSWTHTPVGTPKGVLVLIYCNTITDIVTACTYGGVTCTEVALSPHLGTLEAISVYGYFLGSGIPAGEQTVAYTLNDQTPTNDGVAYTVTATSTTTVIEDTTVFSSEATTAVVMTLTTGANVECVCAGVCGSGVQAVTDIACLADYTDLFETDHGAQCSSFIVKQANSLGGNVTLGWLQSSDDGFALGVAIRDAGDSHPGACAGFA